MEMIRKAFGTDSMSKSNIYEWYNRFKSGRETVASDPRSGRPSSTNSPDNVEKVREAIAQDSRLTMRELEKQLNIPKTVVAEILTEKLGLRRVAAKFVPTLRLIPPVLCNSFWAKLGIPLVPHPPYSPDLAPCDFWLFPKLKSPMKGTRFDSINDPKENTTRALKDIPKECFLDCFEQLKNRWNKCIVSYGEYFEGD